MTLCVCVCERDPHVLMPCFGNGVHPAEFLYRSRGDGLSKRVHLLVKAGDVVKREAVPFIVGPPRVYIHLRMNYGETCLPVYTGITNARACARLFAP